MGHVTVPSWGLRAAPAYTMPMCSVEEKTFQGGRGPGFTSGPLAPQHEVGTESRKGNFIAVPSRRRTSCENRKPPRLLTTLSCSVRSAEAGTHTVSSLIPCQGQSQGCKNKAAADISGKGLLILRSPSTQHFSGTRSNNIPTERVSCKCNPHSIHP